MKMDEKQSRSYWAARAWELALPMMGFVGGRRVSSNSTRCFVKYNPANGDALAELPEGDSVDADAAVAAARAAFDDGRWSDKAPAERKLVLLRLADLIDQHQEELALLEVLDVGKPISDALAIDVPLASSILRYCAEGADKLLGSAVHGDARSFATYLRYPRGVVGAIVGWNFPLVLAVQKLAPALAMGNTVVLKPSELSSFSAIRLAELAMEAGAPEGVFNVTPGLGGVIGDALSRHMDVDMLTFTGSSATGKLIMQAAGASNMKRLLLECGGKAANIVFADCPDLDAVADGVMQKMFWNQGQVCTAGTRLLAHVDVKERLLEKLLPKIAAITPGDPFDPQTTFGPLASKAQMEKTLGYIRNGNESGAILRAGGARARQESGGYYVQPTLFDDVRSSMRIAQEEIFGPVLSVLTFEDADEAVRIGNNTIYGLSSTVWTRDIANAQRMARSLEVGELTIRASGGPSRGPDFASVPLEPHKQSGFGVESGLEGLASYSAMKSVQFLT